MRTITRTPAQPQQFPALSFSLSLAKYLAIDYYQRDHFLQNLVTIPQKSSKVRCSLVLVSRLMWTEWSSSMISSSLIPSPESLARFFNSSKSMTSSSWRSMWPKMVFRPSLVLTSPTFGQTSSRNSSKLMGFPLDLRFSMRPKAKVPFLDSPSSSMILLISSGSMTPE